MTYWDTSYVRQLPRPAARTVGALIGAVSGAVLLAVSFMPWILAGPSGRWGANAWTSLEPPSYGDDFTDLTSIAVLIGVGVGTAAAVRYIRGIISERNDKRWDLGGGDVDSLHGAPSAPLGVWLMIGAVLVIFLSWLRLEGVAGWNRFDGPSISRGIGMTAGWIAAIGLFVGGVMELGEVVLRWVERGNP